VPDTLADVDLDAFVHEHAAEWSRLEQLSGRRRLPPAEADELIDLYRRAATHLALVQSRTPDPAVAARLSRLIASGRAAVVGNPRRRGWAAFAHAITVSFPVAAYQTWRWWAGVAAANVVVSGAMMLYLRDHPSRLSKVIPSAELRELVNHDFADYYSAHPAQSFAAQVWVNNTVVTALCIVLGVTVVGALWVLWQNAVNVGIVGGAMLGAGKANVFFGLILPHGLLELTAVFLAGGAGLRTGWAWIAPGARPRAQALAETGRVTAVIALGLVGVLAVSGAIEAFVTPSGLPTSARIAIGAIVEITFLTYVIVLGRRGSIADETGDLAFDEREAVLPVV
jgi:uncharacterized membrane protein SpoIIM required for sporulation